MSDTHNMPIEPLRVILKTEWTHLKEEFKKVVDFNIDKERVDAIEEASFNRYSFITGGFFVETLSDSIWLNKAGH